MTTKKFTNFSRQYFTYIMPLTITTFTTGSITSTTRGFSIPPPGCSHSQTGVSDNSTTRGLSASQILDALKMVQDIYKYRAKGITTNIEIYHLSRMFGTEDLTEIQAAIQHEISMLSPKRKSNIAPQIHQLMKSKSWTDFTTTDDRREGKSTGTSDERKVQRAMYRAAIRKENHYRRMAIELGDRIKQQVLVQRAISQIPQVSYAITPILTGAKVIIPPAQLTKLYDNIAAFQLTKAAQALKVKVDDIAGYSVEDEDEDDGDDNENNDSDSDDGYEVIKLRKRKVAPLEATFRKNGKFVQLVDCSPYVPTHPPEEPEPPTELSEDTKNACAMSWANANGDIIDKVRQSLIPPKIVASAEPQMEQLHKDDSDDDDFAPMALIEDNPNIVPEHERIWRQQDKPADMLFQEMSETGKVSKKAAFSYYRQLCKEKNCTHKVTISDSLADILAQTEIVKDMAKLEKKDRKPKSKPKPDSSTTTPPTEPQPSAETTPLPQHVGQVGNIEQYMDQHGLTTQDFATENPSPPHTEGPRYVLPTPQPYFERPIAEEKSELAEYNFLHPENAFDPFQQMVDNAPIVGTVLPSIGNPAMDPNVDLNDGIGDWADPTVPRFTHPRGNRRGKPRDMRRRTDIPDFRNTFVRSSTTSQSHTQALMSSRILCKVCGKMTLSSDIHIDRVCKMCIQAKMRAAAEPKMEKPNDDSDKGGQTTISDSVANIIRELIGDVTIRVGFEYEEEQGLITMRTDYAKERFFAQLPPLYTEYIGGEQSTHVDPAVEEIDWDTPDFTTEKDALVPKDDHSEGKSTCDMVSTSGTVSAEDELDQIIALLCMQDNPQLVGGMSRPFRPANMNMRKPPPTRPLPPPPPLRPLPPLPPRRMGNPHEIAQLERLREQKENEGIAQSMQDLKEAGYDVAPVGPTTTSMYSTELEQLYMHAMKEKQLDQVLRQMPRKARSQVWRTAPKPPTPISAEVYHPVSPTPHRPLLIPAITLPTSSERAAWGEYTAKYGFVPFSIWQEMEKQKPPTIVPAQVVQAQEDELWDRYTKEAVAIGQNPTSPTGPLPYQTWREANVPKLSAAEEYRRMMTQYNAPTTIDISSVSQRPLPPAPQEEEEPIYFDPFADYEQTEEEDPFQPEYTSSKNIVSIGTVHPSMRPTKWTVDPESGDYVISTKGLGKKGRKPLPPEKRKYQKKYEKRGRPRGKAKPKPVKSGLTLKQIQEVPEGEDYFDPFAEEEEAPKPFAHVPFEAEYAIPAQRKQAAIRAANIAAAKLSDRMKTQTTYSALLQQAKNNGTTYLSNQITNIYTKTVRINTDKQVSFIGFNFRFDQNAVATTILKGLDKYFIVQTTHLQTFIEGILKRAVEMWRIMIKYNTTSGSFTQSTVYTRSYQKAHKSAIDRIRRITESYGDESLSIEEFEVRVLIGTQSLIGGHSNTAVQEKLGQIKDEWMIVNPHSKSNCLWTCVAIATGYKANPRLIFDTKVQNQAGKNLKRNVGTKNYIAGCDEDIQRMCNYKLTNIEVRNELNVVLRTFHPHASLTRNGDFTTVPTIHLLLMNAHYHAMLPKTCPIVIQNIGLYQEEKAPTLTPIEVFNKELEPRRIISYDIETYRNPKDTEEKEVEQIAYAIAWGFEVNTIEEEVKCEELGYRIEVYDWQMRADEEKYNMVVAYKEEIGDGCLDRALAQWLEQDMFDGACFYAHNGGKFDLRIILGQSDLMYNTRYVISPEKQVFLNGRIVNMDVSNKTVSYNYTGNTGKELTYLHSISLRDSVPLFGADCKLAKLCEELHVPHKKMEEKLNIHALQYEHTWRANWEEHDLAAYLFNDVLGLLEVLMKFNQEVLEGTKIPITCVNTGASLAKKYYLQTFYQPYHEIDQKKVREDSTTIYTLTNEIDQFVREGYGGGRCEAFISKEHNDKCYYYDFTSLYPDVGRLPMPTGMPKWITTTTDPDRKQRIIQGVWNQRILEGDTNEDVVFWKVKVKSPAAIAGNPTSPLYRKPLFGLKEEGMYLFRWFKEETTMVLYEPEIRLARELGLDYDFTPVDGIMFNTSPILASCMEKLFTQKAEAKERGQHALSKTWKIIINSLYGVWGLRTIDREGIEIATPEDSSWCIDMATEKLMDIEKIGAYVVTRRVHDLEVSDCNVAIAAAVTAEARMKLYRLMVDIQDRKGRILYCDTDSIITTHCIETDRELNHKWIGPTGGVALGSLKNEIDECYEKYNKKKPGTFTSTTKHFDQCVIVAPKLYIIQAQNGKIMKKAHKGYRETEEDQVTYDRMKTLINLDIPATMRNMQQDTVQWVGGNRDIIQNNIGVRNIKRHKVITRTVNKGTLDNEQQIVPFTTKPNTVAPIPSEAK